MAVVWLATPYLVKVLIATSISVTMKNIEGGTRPLQVAE